VLTGCFNSGAYRKMTALKWDYPHLKVLLSVWEYGNEMVEVAASPSRRKVLVTNVSEYLR
jgi:GH18 family chitinase